MDTAIHLSSQGQMSRPTDTRPIGYALVFLLAPGLLAGCTDPPPDITFEIMAVESTSHLAGPGWEDQVAVNVTLEVKNEGKQPYRMEFDDWAFQMDTDGAVKFSGFRCLTPLGAVTASPGTSTTWQFFLFILGTPHGNLTSMAFRDNAPQRIE
jgi:hypothetical protein